jgi:hypothetical protein
MLCNNKHSSDTVTNLPQESHGYWISSICCLKEVMQSSLVILLYTTATLIVELAQPNLHNRYKYIQVSKWLPVFTFSAYVGHIKILKIKTMDNIQHSFHTSLEQRYCTIITKVIITFSKYADGIHCKYERIQGDTNFTYFTSTSQLFPTSLRCNPKMVLIFMSNLLGCWAEFVRPIFPLNKFPVTQILCY